MREPGFGNPAQFFLANTGRLQLTDQQVTRLAAIARRAEARREARRVAMDSMRSRMMAQGMPSDSAGRAARRTAMQSTMRNTMEQVREQNRADLRDALAVLTPDQQARAWEMRGARARAPGRVSAGGFRRTPDRRPRPVR